MEKNIAWYINKRVERTVGDSMTLFETGVMDFFRKGNFVFIDKYREGITIEEKLTFT
ncbi:hypothetical protein SAMN02745176_02772 [Lutispora thermophila DSM 19022]|uniref:Uncharacterized protein n=1 Tax=Lutispora thermophila DSM 19022 TaxID=1122184 RepID=A0A1M6HE96_9FIRM|nr:hypothetical protein SAMN02745176_02772 [Lutispora thermophila DSM 19022]